MSDKMEMLRENGFDVDSALRRVLGKEDFYIKMLKKFPEDCSFRRLKEGLAEKDTVKAFEGAHTLKGISGNVGITPVYAADMPVVELLREGSVKGIEPYIQTLEAAYARAISIIAEL